MKQNTGSPYNEIVRVLLRLNSIERTLSDLFFLSPFHFSSPLEPISTDSSFSARPGYCQHPLAEKQKQHVKRLRRRRQEIIKVSAAAATSCEGGGEGGKSSNVSGGGQQAE